MNISHSLSIKVTKDTFVSSYNNGNSQSCTFIENGDSLSICFDRNCLSTLSEAIAKLQEVYQILLESRQRQIAREFDQLSLPTSNLPIIQLIAEILKKQKWHFKGKKHD